MDSIFSSPELRDRREKRKTFFHHCHGCRFTRFSAKPKNETVSACRRCGKEKRIHADGMCSRCYDKENSKGLCKECDQRAVLRAGLCDSCYRKEHMTGKCSQCKKQDVLVGNGMCRKCYTKNDFRGICRDCGEEGRLSKGLCSSCWDKENRSGSCKQCGHVGSLRDGYCSTCYKNKDEKAECKICGNVRPLSAGLCRTCYDKEHYSGVCDSCGDFGVLVKGYCRSCYDSQGEMSECTKCGNSAVLDHNGICQKCSKKQYDVGLCRVCAKERPLVFGNMCMECYKNKSEGIQHYMKSSLKRIIERLLGNKNFKKDPEEIFLRGEKDPFQADFEMRDLNGKWCPGQYFNSKDEWSYRYKNVVEFKDFYHKYLKPKNYIMFTSMHSRPEIIKQYLIDRGFLQPTGLPYGKKMTMKKPISKRPLEKV